MVFAMLKEASKLFGVGVATLSRWSKKIGSVPRVVMIK